MVGRGKLYGKKVISEQVNKLLKQYKVGKHFTVEVRDDGLDYYVDAEALGVCKLDCVSGQKSPP